MNPIIATQKRINITGVVLGLDVVRPKGYSFPGEAHDFWEAVFVCDGRIAVSGDERIYHLKEGMVVFHKPMEFHRFWTESDIAPHLLIISFQAEGADVHKLENQCFHLTTREQDELLRITHGINRVEQNLDCSGTENWKKDLSITATRLELLLQELLDHSNAISTRLTPDEDMYVRILKVMKENCGKVMTVSDIAKLCNMSVSNMKRIFSQFSDMGVAKYFLSLKMCRAIELLELGKNTKQVALELGYKEVGYFCTVFKRETGITPQQYKKCDDCVRSFIFMQKVEE